MKINMLAYCPLFACGKLNGTMHACVYFVNAHS